MQEKIKINGIVVVQPDEYSANLATTSTDDSDRDQSLVMHNTPIGTVASYSMKWSYIDVADAAVILQQILNKSSFRLHYFDIITASWKDSDFYATTFNSPAKTLEEGDECWEELSFNVVKVRPV